MTQRNPIVVVVLTFVTFTLYGYYWLYKTTDELRSASAREDLSPIVDVVLTAVTLGLWGLWATYRNARIAHELFEQRGLRHTDRSLPVAVFGALSFVSGWAWLVSMALLQEDFNRLAEPADRFAGARPHEAAEDPPRVRLEPEPARQDARAPSAPVFESNAPAPIVF